MRWKLLRRRLSISAPRVIVRRHLPWPLRWAAVAVVLGLSGAIALWAFEWGKEIAGLDRRAKEELARLRIEVAQLREARDKAQSLADTSDSVLRAERTAQDRLMQQMRQLEAGNQALRADLGFFERLLPAQGGDGPSIRSLQAVPQAPGQLRYQLLVMQGSRSPAEFKGRFEWVLGGMLEGRPWTLSATTSGGALVLTQYARSEGLIEYPVAAVVKTVQVRIVDHAGAMRASHTLRL